MTSIILFFIFCFLRPRHNAVYAPRAKHADAKHAPPAVGKGLFSWFRPLRKLKEDVLVEQLGLDAVIFLRFLRMTRNIFLALSVIGLGILLPVNLIGGHGIYKNYADISIFMKFTPLYTFGQKCWAFTICAYLFDIVICGFLWLNYRAVLRLRRVYFESADYKASLHSRTLMLTHIPNASRTDEGIVQLVEQAKRTADDPRGAISRNVKDLPELMEDHEEAVRELEGYLAKYLKDPNRLPRSRPVMKPFKRDKARKHDHKVDAIEYLTSRIRELELEITQVRETVDKRNPMPFGFASYPEIEDAHAVAYAARSKGPQGTRIRLAPKPHDIIWKNMPMTRAARRSRSFWNGLSMTLLTVLYVIPNVLTAVFLSDFANLGTVWHGFQQSLEAHSTWWGIVQGILAPAIQALFYLFLPTIFRRLFNKAGDTTKTSRERHVTNRLYAFFVFNQLFIFSIFAAVWRYISAVIAASRGTEDAWQAIKDQHPFAKLVQGFCQVSPFFITWQMQHFLGVAVDLIQLWPLVWSFCLRRFSNPTPRQTIELTAPQPFEYASYYNNYLFAATIGFAFATLQPLILPVTAIYIGIDFWCKTYLLQYVCITKTESGGLFWRILVNRTLFGALIGNLVIALVVGAQGVVDFSGAGAPSAAMLYALVPLPFLLLAFKLYCQRYFDIEIAYYTTKTISDLERAKGVDLDKKNRRTDRVGVRFGNPALYKKLMVPMVSAKSQHLLKEIYKGRLDHDMQGGQAGNYGYSDVYMSDMSHGQPGKTATGNSPFEIVSESDMDFENFKKRAEFREQFGGDGQLYGHADDQTTTHGSRPGSVASMDTLAMLNQKHRYNRSDSTTADSRASSRTRYDPDATDASGMTYPRGYHTALRNESPNRGVRDADIPLSRMDSTDITASGHPAFRDGDDDSLRGRRNLMGHAAGMGHSTPPAAQSPGQMRGVVGGYYDYRSGDNSTAETPGDEDTSYDYFRRGRRNDMHY